MTKGKYYNPNTFNALHAAIAFLLFFAVSFLASFLVGFAMADGRISPNEGNAPYYCLSILAMAAGLWALSFAFGKACKVSLFNGGGFLVRKGQGTDMLMAAVGVCGGVVLLSPLADSFSAYFTYLGDFFHLPSSGAGMGAGMEGSAILIFVYSFVLTPLLPAIFEELFFRGVVLRGFMQYGKPVAIVLSSALFALAHGNVSQLVYQFLVGMFLGFLFVETKNILVPMVAHFTNNFFAVVYATVVYPKEGGMGLVYMAIAEIMYTLIAIVCFAAATVYFAKRAAHSLKHPERAEKETKAAFCSFDSVLGNVLEERAWFLTGELACGGEEKTFLLGENRRAKLNKKAKFLPVAIVLGVGIVLAVALVLLGFFGVL